MIKAAAATCFQAIEHHARVTPDHIALIYGGLDENLDTWKRLSYKDLQARVRAIAANVQAKLLLARKKGCRCRCRVLVLYRPPSKVDLIAMMVALQTLGCVPIFAHPRAFGGLRHWAEVMMNETHPDAILCTPSVLVVFRTLLLTSTTSLKSHRKLVWINASAVFQSNKKQETETAATETEASASAPEMETEIAQLFSSGSTGPPTPIAISHGMQQFQLQRYAEQLQQRNLSPSGWTGCHFSINFVMLDLALGATAVLHPFELSRPIQTVRPALLAEMYNSFDVQVASAPPAVWNKLCQHDECLRLPKLQLVLAGGAETSVRYVRSTCELLTGKHVEFHRVYGTTQVLPIAGAKSSDVLETEATTRACQMGGGVCLGTVAEGLDVLIDQDAWSSAGGSTELQLPHATVHVGELCVTGHALSPSLPVAAVAGEALEENAPPKRTFHTGDVCYMDPQSKLLFFLGRMKQAVPFRDRLVPPACLEMVLYEAGIVSRCALVGPQRRAATIPVLVVQLTIGSTLPATLPRIRAALQQSIWSSLVGELRLAVYPKSWPVDERHSSKTNRNLLKQWAVKLHERKLAKL